MTFGTVGNRFPVADGDDPPTDYGIIVDLEDQDDHDTLRTDPVFKLLAGLEPTRRGLAS